MTRALVLGGGGPLGVGWQAGLLTALTDAAVPLADGDYVVGTSAGSIVGAQLMTGRPLSGWGRSLMDLTRTAAAFDAGLRQGRAETEPIRRLWTR